MPKTTISMTQTMIKPKAKVHSVAYKAKSTDMDEETAATTSFYLTRNGAANAVKEQAGIKDFDLDTVEKIRVTVEFDLPSGTSTKKTSKKKHSKDEDEDDD